ncbi:CARDB domain-containing protein [Natronospora cellulosivora (SeqCode)]
MLKKYLNIFLVFAFLLIMANTANAGIEYIESQSLIEERTVDFKALSLLVKSYNSTGDISELQEKLLFHVEEEDLIGQAFSLLAVPDTSLAEKLAVEQNYQGDWEEDIYLTSLISYAFLIHNLELSTARVGLNYLSSVQNIDGGWGQGGQSAIQETALALLALTEGDYSGKPEINAVNWLLRQQSANGSWGNNINTAWTLLALEKMNFSGELEEEKNEAIENAVDYFKMAVNFDAGWGLQAGEESNLFTTALILLALQEYDPELLPVVNGLEFLEELISDQAWLNKAFAYYRISEIDYLLRNTSYSGVEAKYSNYLTTFPEQNNYDYLARRISILARRGKDYSEFLEQLLAGQNYDGGWGFAVNYESSPWETALALRALLDIQYSDLSLYRNIITYFNNNNNANGSFSIKRGEAGNTYLTSIIVEELKRLNEIIGTGYLLNHSRQWLISQRNSDGSYGDILETARAFAVTIDQLSVSEIMATLDFIYSQKQANASWNNDSLSTAAVLSALELIKPNLTIESEDISFSQEEVYYSDKIDVELIIKNIGFADVEDLEVALYNGIIADENLLRTEILALVPAQEQITLEYSWELLEIGRQEFTVLIDPEAKIEEMDKSNNHASKLLNVIPRVDLAIKPENIRLVPENPGTNELLEVRAEIENLGFLAAEEIEVLFTLAKPEDEDSITLDVIEIDVLEGQESIVVVHEMELPEGDYIVYVTIDPDNKIEEDRIDNNQAYYEFDVCERIDLAISHNDIRISESNPVEGDTITVYAIISNLRETTVNNVPIAFYLDEMKEENIIEIIVLEEVKGNHTALAELELNTTGLLGRNAIYINIDPENTIQEVDKYNNFALEIFNVQGRPDLTASLNFYSMTEGVPGRIRITVLNQGENRAEEFSIRTYLNGMEDENILTDDIVINGLDAGRQQAIDIYLDTVNRAGTHSFYLEIDPDNHINESDKSNNLLLDEFTIDPPAEIVVEASKVAFEPEIVYEGDQVLISSQIDNVSTISVSNMLVHLYELIEDEWVLLGEETLSVSADNSAKLEIAWDSDYKLGNNSFKIVADPENNFYERDKSNNTAYVDLEVLLAIYPDFLIRSEDISFEPARISRDSTGIIKAEVQNIRTVPAENVLVRFYNGNPIEEGEFIGETSIDIGGRSSSIAEIDWDTSALRAFQEIYVWVNPEGYIEEASMDNNLASRIVQLYSAIEEQPQNLQANVIENNLYLEWDRPDIDGITGYMIYVDNQLDTPEIEVERGVAEASSTFSSYRAERALQDSSYWRGANSSFPYWFTEEFDEYQYLEEIEIDWYYNAHEYEIQVWTGDKYLTIIEVNDNNERIVKHQLAENGIYLKKYRIVINRTSHSSRAGINIINLKGREVVESEEYNKLDLAAGNYRYAVSSLNQNGEESTPAEIDVVISPPLAPVNFESNVDGSNVYLNWQESLSEDVVGYYLRRDGSLIGESEILSGSAEASGFHGNSYTPDRVLDGSNSTYWQIRQTSSDEIWWQLNLENERYLSLLQIDWRSTPSYYRVLAWQGGEWQEIVEINDYPGNNHLLDLPGDFKTDKMRIEITDWHSGRDLRINQIEVQGQKRITDTEYIDQALKASNYQYSLSAVNNLSCESEITSIDTRINLPERVENLEIEVVENDLLLSWEHNQEEGLLGYLVYRNGNIINKQLQDEIATHGQLLVSSNQGNVERAISRSTSYWQSSGAYPQWFEISYDSLRLISEISIKWRSSSYSARDYFIQYRVGDEWYNIVELKDNNALENIHRFEYPVYTDGIRIYVQTGNHSSAIRIEDIYLYETILSKELNYIDQSVPDGSHDYQIQAVDEAINLSPISEVSSINIGDIVSPKNLQASVDENIVDLSWDIDSLEGIIDFNIYRNSRLIQELGKVSNEFSASASINDNTINRIFDGNSNTYWEIRSWNCPATIEVETAMVKEINRIKINWRTASELARDLNVLAMVDGEWQVVYELRDNSEPFNELIFDSVKTNRIMIEILSGSSRIRLTSLELFDEGLVRELKYKDIVYMDGDYTYWVKAVSKEGKVSSASNSVIVKTVNNTPPVMPENFAITEINNNLRLSWSANQENVAGYDLYLNDSEIPLNTGLIRANTYNYSIQPGLSEYNFRLVAEDKNGRRSDDALATFEFSRPLSPLNFETTVTKRDVQLNWQASGSMNILGYRIFRDGEILNNRSRMNPENINASSLYLNNNNYHSNNVNDRNDSTFWRPASNDQNPYLELKYSNKILVSVLEISWHSIEAIPEEYMVQAYINGQWQDIYIGSGLAKEVYTLPEIVLTDSLRILINDNTSSTRLARFEVYQSSLSTRTNWSDNDLEPGEYTYSISSVNRIGLESIRSEEVLVEISKKNLAIQAGDLYYTPYKPSIFDNISIFVQVRNQGQENVSDVPVGIYLRDDEEDTLLTTLLIDEIEVGERTLLQYNWDPTGFAGEFELIAIVDPENTINEYDKGNNQQSIGIEIAEEKVLNTELASICSNDFSEITLSVQVNDLVGNGVAGLNENNFIIFEDGTKQQITSFTSIVDEATEIPRVDLVFVIDTSGSMGPIWDDIPLAIVELTDEMIRRGIDLEYKIYSMRNFWSGTQNIPTNEILRTGIFRGQNYTLTTECWGPATAWIAEYYSWRDRAFRVIVPIADENAYRGNPQRPESLESLAEAIDYSLENNVEVYPIYQDYYWSQQLMESVIEEMTEIAEATGGEVFHFEEYGSIANALARVLSRKKVDYSIVYQSSKPARDGTIREVLVETNYRYAEGQDTGSYRAPQDSYSNLQADRLEADRVIAANQVISLRGKVSNIGGVIAYDIPVSFYLGNPEEGGLEIVSKIVSSLAPQESREIEIEWLAQAGKHQIYMIVDPDDIIEETSRDNNIAIVELEIPGRQKADLLVLEDEIYFDRYVSLPGEMLELNARVRNIGADVGRFTVGFYQGNPYQEGKLITNKVIEGLEYLDYQDLTITWITGYQAGEEDIYVIADPENRIDEVNTDNNMAFKTINIANHSILGHVSTDRLEYHAGEDILISMEVENSSQAMWSGEAVLSIEDLHGNQVEEIQAYFIEDLYTELDAENQENKWKESFIWNLDNLISDKYRAVLRLKQGGDLIAVYASEFEVLPELAVRASLYTNKDRYYPYEDVVIDLSYENLSTNASLEDIDIEIIVGKENDDKVYYDSLRIDYLAIGFAGREVFYFPTANHKPDNYYVKARLLKEEEILWSEEKAFTIEGQIIPEGLLTIESSYINSTDDMLFEYQIRNNGNSDIKDSLLELLAINLENEEILDRIVLDQSFDLAPADIVSESKVRDMTLIEGQYMLILQIRTDEGDIYPIDSSAFTFDETPPVTTVHLEGEELSDNVFESEVQVSLAADDNGGSGVAAIYYMLDGGDEQLYTEPFFINKEGISELEVYAVDNCGNYESPQLVQISIYSFWGLEYSVLTQQLRNAGAVTIDTAFSNGPVVLKGACQLNYLGTAESSVDMRGNIRVNELETDLPYKSIPVPKWEELKAASNLISPYMWWQNLEMEDARFEGNTMLLGTQSVKGLIVVDGDLEIVGDSQLIDVAIFATGNIKITGRAEIKGLIYAGGDLKVAGDINVSGVIIVNGLANITGKVSGDEISMDEYWQWLKY